MDKGEAMCKTEGLTAQFVSASARYLPLPVLGRAVGITGEDFEVAMKAWNVVNEAGLRVV